MALLRASGAGVVCVVASPGDADQRDRDGLAALRLPPSATRIAVPCHQALLLAAHREGLLPDAGRNVLIGAHWDPGGLTVCAVDLSGSAPRELACVMEPALGAAQAGAHLGMTVLLPAVTRLSAELAAGVAAPGVRQRLAMLGERVLRRYWEAPDPAFTVMLPPGHGLSAVGSSAVSIPRDAIHAACRRVVADARDVLARVAEQSGLADGSRVQLLVSGEAARWMEARAALQSALPDASLTVPAWPECFLARGAAQAAAAANER